MIKKIVSFEIFNTVIDFRIKFDDDSYQNILIAVELSKTQLFRNSPIISRDERFIIRPHFCSFHKIIISFIFIFRSKGGSDRLFFSYQKCFIIVPLEKMRNDWFNFIQLIIKNNYIIKLITKYKEMTNKNI